MAPATAANPSAFSPFRPSDAAAADIFSDIATGRVSLADLAAAHGATLEALALWLEEPDTSERHTRLNAGFAAAVRTATLCHLPAAVPALARILRDFTAHTTAPAASAASSAPDLPSRDAPIPPLRFAALALRAASLLHRLSRVSGDAPRKLLPRQGEVAAQRPEGATAFPTPPLPAQLNESPHHFAPAPDSPRDPDPETRNPIPSSTSAIPHPTSDITSTLDSLESLSDEELFAALQRGDIDPAELLAAAGFTAGPAP